MQALDASPLVKTWHRSKVRIRYLLGIAHYYEPDLFVVYYDGRKFLEEIKGRIWSPNAYKQKVRMAEHYCRKKKWVYRVLFEEDIDTVL